MVSNVVSTVMLFLSCLLLSLFSSNVGANFHSYQPYSSFALRSNHNHILINQHNSPKIINLRGGASSSSSDSESDCSDSDYSDDSDMNIDELDDNNFDSGNLSTRLMQSLQSTPPLTKLFLTSSLIASLSGFVFNHNQFPPILEMNYVAAVQKMQIWRFFTSFLNLGPFGVSWLLTAQFSWMYMSTLEKLNHDEPYDFWLMMLFGMTSMSVSYGILGISPRFLGHNLSTYLVYIWSRYHEGLEVNLMEVSECASERK